MSRQSYFSFAGYFYQVRPFYPYLPWLLNTYCMYSENKLESSNLSQSMQFVQSIKPNLLIRPENRDILSAS